MDISTIASVELDRSVPFHHTIRIKDHTGFTMETIPVNDSTGWEQFEEVWVALCKHPEFNLKGKKG